MFAATLSGCGFFSRSDQVNTVQLRKDFQALLDTMLEEHGFTGAVAAYTLPDGEITVVASGHTDLEHKIPMPPDARMLTGTMGKSFTAAVALCLVHDGELDLDRRIYTYLDTTGEDAWLLRLPNARRLTMRHLLTHSSGLIDYIDDPSFLESSVRHREESGPDWQFPPGELLEFAMDRDALFDQGRGFHYSDTNYILAGLVLEKISGKLYYDILQDRILTPLNLNATSPADHRKLDGLVPGYLTEGNPFFLPTEILDDGALIINPASEWTGGGLISNPGDLVKWAKNLYEEDALPGTYLEDLFESGYRGKDRESTYGLGVYIYSTTVGEAFGHSGSSPGYNTNLLYFPRQRIAVCIQINRDYGNDLEAMIETLAQTVINALPS